MRVESKMNNVMIDIETMGSGSSAAIVSIGAVYFDEKGLGEEFYINVDLATAMEKGGEIDGDTVMWWLGQAQEARQSLKGNLHDIGVALFKLSLFLGAEDGEINEQLKVWGNGAGFDNVILAGAYSRCQIQLPWKFWNDRCYRTMKSLFRDVKLERKATYHNALDDAKTQALHLIEIAQTHAITFI